jgi:HK97 family phage portal protein
MRIETLGSLALAAGHDITPAKRWIEAPSEEAIYRGYGWGVYGPTDTGITVTESNALSYMPVLACVRVISETLGMLPLDVFDEDGPKVARNHYARRILHDLPNPEMTHFAFWEAYGVSIGLYNNFYAEIEWNQAGRVRALWPLLPDRIEKKRTPNGVVFDYTTDSGKVRLPAEHVLHIPGCLTLNGAMADSLIKYAREAIGLGLAPEKFAAGFYRNNARPGMYLAYPNVIPKEVKKGLVESWDAIHSGLQGAHRTGVVDGGGELRTVGIGQKDAEFSETRMAQLRMVCGVWRVPPHMIADLGHATFSNIEEQNIQFAMHTIAPYAKRAEEVINWKILGVGSGYYSHFALDELMRGNFAGRIAALSGAVQNALRTPNEARAVDNLPPIEGGDKLYIQGATVPLEDAGAQVEQAKTTTPNADNTDGNTPADGGTKE